MWSEGKLGSFGEGNPGNRKAEQVGEWEGLMGRSVDDLGCCLKESWEGLERPVLESERSRRLGLGKDRWKGL